MTDPTIDNPTEAVEHDNPFFEPIWNAIKTWDLERSPGELYANATGTDVQTILDAIKPVLAQAKEAWTREALQQIAKEPPTYKAKRLDGREVEGYYVKHINATPYPIASDYEHQKFLDEHTEHVIMVDDFSDWGLPRNAKPHRIDITTLELQEQASKAGRTGE